MNIIELISILRCISVSCDIYFHCNFGTYRLILCALRYQYRRLMRFRCLRPVQWFCWCCIRKQVDSPHGFNTYRARKKGKKAKRNQSDEALTAEAVDDYEHEAGGVSSPTMPHGTAKSVFMGAKKAFMEDIRGAPSATKFGKLRNLQKLLEKLYENFRSCRIPSL
jgi:hypothetical protein